MDAPSYLGVRNAWNWNVSAANSGGNIDGELAPAAFNVMGTAIIPFAV